ncbi:MAG: glycosyltransferase family 4 protein [Terriglobales bacterium]|jgi:phosphatidylinositol alpha-1,6-mannosyltransferase
MVTFQVAQSTSRTPDEGRTGVRRLGNGALLTPDFPPLPGGISNYLFNVYRQFDLRRMMLIAPKHPDAERFDSLQDYSAKRFRLALDVPGIRGAWQVWRMYREAEKLVKQNRDLVLHCGHVNAAIAARKLKSRYGIPYLLWTHALEIMDEWLRASIMPAMLDADLVITNSEFTRAFVASAGVAQSRIVKIRPGVDPTHFRPGLDCSALAQRLGVFARPTLLTVSRIVKANRYKGHDVVLHALARVVRAVPDVVYVIAGDGDDLDYLDRLARECGVRANAVFAGHVSDEELPLLYNACDAFVMCSREERTRRGILAEGFGLALLEASACAKPVIAGRSGGVPDAAQDGITGLLVSPADSEAVAAAIIKVLREPGVANTMGENGRRWVETEMNWTRAADEFEQTMKKFFPQVFFGGKDAV